MSINIQRFGLAIVLLGTVLISLPALAWNPFSKASEFVGNKIEAGGERLGQGLGKGVAEAIQPALASTIMTASKEASGLLANTETRVSRQVDHVGDVASRLVSETRGAIDQSLVQVDQILEKRLLQVQTTGEGLIQKLDSAVDRNLATADRILKERSIHLGTIVSDSIGQADRALEARIDQLDQAVALRLGNVDVIATKQRLGLEQSLLRAGVLIGILVFLIYVLRTLWRDIAVVRTRVGEKHGWGRAFGFAAGFSRTLIIQVAAAGIAIGILAILYDRLPFGARAQVQELASMHRREMNQSLSRFDFPRVRFHASQLEILLPEEGGYYQAMATKSEILRDLVLRPALLSTLQGQTQVVERIQALERQLGKRADPDLLTLKALVIWQTGDSKSDEHEAASLCARALRLSSSGFSLAPLARHYIRRFLHTPYLPENTPFGRDAESLPDLRVLAMTPLDEEGFPLAPVLALDKLMARVDREVSPAYLAMVTAQAEVAKILRDLPRPQRGKKATSPALEAALKRRNERASHVYFAWRGLDRDLARNATLSGKSAVLAIFRINDATFTRAAWFVENPTATTPAPRLSEITDLKLRAKLAPPRVTWEKRYKALFADELRTLAAFQEANRFLDFEKTCFDFEEAFVAQALQGPEAQELRRQAAILSARLGLYVPGAPGRRGTRVPAALAIAPFDKSPELAEALQTRALRFL